MFQLLALSQKKKSVKKKYNLHLIQLAYAMLQLITLLFIQPWFKELGKVKKEKKKKEKKERQEKKKENLNINKKIIEII